MKYYLKRLKALLLGWKNQPTKSDIDRLTAQYSAQTAEMPQEKVLRLLGNEKLLNLVHISRYAELGETRAIQFAFAFGYKAGKGGAV